MSSFTRNDLKEWFRTTHPSANVEENETDNNLLTETGTWYQMEEPSRPGDIANRDPGRGKYGDSVEGSEIGPMGSHLSRDQWENYRMQHIDELAAIFEQYPDMAETETDLREYWNGVVHQALKKAFML